MQTLDVATLDGWLLDYFTGVALGYEMRISHNGFGPAYRERNPAQAFEPTRRPDDMLPVLQHMTTVLRIGDRGPWQARVAGCRDFGDGHTASVAVCRALVLARLGRTVQHPSPAPVAASCEDLFA